jgi:hypothetical protein
MMLRTLKNKIINEMIQKMNNERAYDALLGEVIEKVVFSYKFHHPTIREVLEYFVDSLIENGRKFLKASQFVDLTK